MGPFTLRRLELLRQGVERDARNVARSLLFLPVWVCGGVCVCVRGEAGCSRDVCVRLCVGECVCVMTQGCGSDKDSIPVKSIESQSPRSLAKPLFGSEEEPFIPTHESGSRSQSSTHQSIALMEMDEGV